MILSVMENVTEELVSVFLFLVSKEVIRVDLKIEDLLPMLIHTECVLLLLTQLLKLVRL
jgi:hypothetical protein